MCGGGGGLLLLLILLDSNLARSLRSCSTIIRLSSILRWWDTTISPLLGVLRRGLADCLLLRLNVDIEGRPSWDGMILAPLVFLLDGADLGGLVPCC